MLDNGEGNAEVVDWEREVQGIDDLGSELQSWQEKLGSSSVRHRSWFPGSNEKDIGFGIDAVGDDKREDEDAEAHHQGDKLQEGVGREGERCSQNSV